MWGASSNQLKARTRQKSCLSENHACLVALNLGHRVFLRPGLRWKRGLFLDVSSPSIGMESIPSAFLAVLKLQVSSSPAADLLTGQPP